MRRQWNLPLAARTPVVFLAVFCLGSVLTAWAVDYPLRWRWSNPKPHGGNVVEMAFSPAVGVALQTAELGQIFSSSDLNFWIPRASGTSNDLRAIAFLGSRVLVTGANGTVLYADSLDDFRSGVLTSGATADWLEAVTVSASSSLAVAVGDNGAVYTSTNGLYWKRQSSNTSEWLRGVTFGNGLFVAVGENGKIIVSGNGTNWGSRSSGTIEHLNRVGFYNNRFTAVAENGVCRFSTNNAVDWWPDISGATNGLFAAANGMGMQLLVGDHEVHSRTNSGPWKNELAQAGGPTPWTYFTAIKPPDFFLIAGRSGLMEEGHLFPDPNTISWRPGDDSARNWLWDITYPTNIAVAVGDRATVMTSVNGVDWKLELVPESVTNAIFLGVGGNSSMLVTVGSAGSLIVSPNTVSNYTVTNIVGTNVVITNISSSSFGVIWYPMVSTTTNDLQGMAASSNLFVATGNAGTIITSSDATNWAAASSPTTRFLSSVTAWPGGWVATGDEGVILRSTDGKTWQPSFANTTNWIYRVRYLGGRLIAVGQNGSILTSSDALIWTKQTSGTTKWLNDVAFLADTWFAVGNSGTVLASTNCTLWTSIGTITRKHLYGAATDARQLLTVGIEGAILRSPVIPDLTPIRILSYDHVVTNTVYGPVSQNIYLFGGQPDQRFTLDYRAGLETNLWTTGTPLEFYDGSGTLFYLELITSSQPPSREFYRATLLPGP